MTLVFGELVPKRIAMPRAERRGMLAPRPLATMSTLARPAVWLLSKSADVAVRLLGGDPSQQRDEITEEELREMVSAQSGFTTKQRLLIDGAFEIAQRTLSKVLPPRPDVFVLEAATPCSTALHQLAATGHSRAPVGHVPTLDDMIGVVHLRDRLSGGDSAVADVVAPPGSFPETASVLHELPNPTDPTRPRSR